MSVVKKFQVFVKKDQISESMLSYLGFTQFTVILTRERNNQECLARYTS